MIKDIKLMSKMIVVMAIYAPVKFISRVLDKSHNVLDKMASNFYNWSENIITRHEKFLDKLFSIYSMQDAHDYLIVNEEKIVDDCVTLYLSGIAQQPYKKEVLWEDKHKTFKATCNVEGGEPYTLRAYDANGKELMILWSKERKDDEKEATK